ncbi:MAG: hypothetical protein RRA92_09485 [Gemmatimonadota bacterium]|nr:hypothetical protein [Gemmatimonadota bacterium]
MIRIHRGPSRRPLRTRSLPLPLLMLIAGTFTAAPAHGQQPGGEAATDAGSPGAVPARQLSSSYLPLDHWAVPAIDLWIARGRIRTLSPFVKPWRRIEVAAALLALDPEALSGAERRWLARLEEEFAPERARLRGEAAPEGEVAFSAAAGFDVWSQTHRDPLRAELDGEFGDAELLEAVGLEAEGHAGPVAGAMRLWRRGLYREDAQFPGGQVTPPREAFILDDVSSRFEESYLELQSPYARVSFGRMYRNWGPPGLPGFLRSSYAYSEDEIGYRLGTERIFAIGTIASYSDFGGDTTRYVSAHRLEVRPFDDLILAISESSVHGGPSENLDWRLVNPLTVWQFTGDEEKTPFNKVGQADVWWHAGPGLNLYGSLLADATNREGSCCQMGGSFGIELPSLLSAWLLRGTVTAIQSLAYRTELPWEEYSVNRIGLGWDKVDLYLATLEASGIPLPGLWLQPRIDLQVRGEGDFRTLRPPGEVLDTFPRILVGQEETTIRPSLAGRWHAGTRAPVDVFWDVGLNVVRDYRNREGDDRTEFTGRLEVRIASPRSLIRLP